MQKSGEVIDYEILMQAKGNRLVHASLTAHFLYDSTGHLSLNQKNFSPSIFRA